MMGGLFQGGYILVVFNTGNLKTMMLVYTNMLPFLGGLEVFTGRRVQFFGGSVSTLLYLILNGCFH